MLPEELELETTGESSYADDTLLPKDLAESLQNQKQQREEILQIRQKILSFFISWTFHATGVAVAKWCLVLGGSTALWTASTLCFTISFVPTIFLASGININFVDNQFEARNMQRLGGLIVGGTTATIATFLAVKDYQYFHQLTQQTVAQLSDDIRTIQKQHPETDPWLSIAIATVIFIGGMVAIFGGRKG